MLQQLLPCFYYKIKLSFEGESHYHTLRVTLRVFAPSREIVRGLRASYRAAFHDRDCPATMGPQCRAVVPNCSRQEPERLRQSFYNRLVAALEQGHSQDL